MQICSEKLTWGNIMSGAANQGAFGNGGRGQSPWGAGPGWGPAGGNQGGSGWGRNGWGPDYFQLWSMSRPLLIAATIMGFLIWWPVGLALLFVSIWNKRMGRWAFGQRGYANASPWAAWASCCGGRATQSSGNRAFDEYREETLRRLEEEQKEFSAFLDRLRVAKDKAEFDQFMAERRTRPEGGPGASPQG
jgi:hypothetical protein